MNDMYSSHHDSCCQNRKNGIFRAVNSDVSRKRDTAVYDYFTQNAHLLITIKSHYHSMRAVSFGYFRASSATMSQIRFVPSVMASFFASLDICIRFSWLIINDFTVSETMLF